MNTSSSITPVRFVVRCKSVATDKGHSIIAPTSWPGLLERVQALYPNKIPQDQLDKVVFHVQNLKDAKLDQHDWPHNIKEGDVISFRIVLPRAETSLPKQAKQAKRKGPETHVKESNVNISRLDDSDIKSIPVMSNDDQPPPYPSHTCTNQPENDTLEHKLPQLSYGSVQIYVKDLTGRTKTIDCDLGDTIETFKIRVWGKFKTPVDLQRLIFYGKQMEDGRTLADYKVCRESTIHLVQRLCGAKPVIYLYPTKETQVSVDLQLHKDSYFTHLYPTPNAHDSNQLQWIV